MGTVWRAYDEVLRREVAIKEVRSCLDMTLSQLEQMNARLEREAWAAARIQHPNVIVIFDVVSDYDRPWIVMELIHGSSMADLLEAEDPLAPPHMAHIGAEVAAALSAAHRAGVLHRDVKPANVLVSQGGRVVLTDFGIAMVEGSPSLTLTGEMVGSPEFLAPERALGHQPGPASDLWALGIMLYRAAEGHTPFRQSTPLMTLRAIVEEVLPPASAAGPLAPVIEGLLRKDPVQRLTAEQAERALRSVSRSEDFGGTAIAFPTHTVSTNLAPGGATVGTNALAPVPKPRWRSSRIAVLGLAVSAMLLAGVLANSVVGENAAAGRKKSPTTVSVTVSGINTAYSGDCPPGRDSAPTLVAMFKSDRTPNSISYRWVAQGTSLLDPEWKTLRFDDESFTRKVSMDFSGYQRDIPIGVQIGVEMRAPRTAKSNFVPVAMSCRRR
nr:serine/threonine-protein kinase [Streptomyces sp. ok210]